MDPPSGHFLVLKCTIGVYILYVAVGVTATLGPWCVEWSYSWDCQMEPSETAPPHTPAKTVNQAQNCILGE